MDEVDRMVALGLVTDPHRYEVYDGRIWEKMSQNDPHVWGLTLAFRALVAIFGLENVNSQVPVRFDGRDAPEPDIVVMDGFTPRPRPGQVRLVMEIADTSLTDDLGPKVAVYARHAVAEYWVLDLKGRALVVHRRADGEGWREVTRFAETESVAPLAAPDRTVEIRALLALPEA